jgi:hypothetical protein
VARRALQLPVAPGALSASVDRYLLPAGSAPELRVRSISGTAAAAVNVFRGGHWVVATSVPESEAAEAGVALPPLQPGVHHIQVQASPWDPQGSAVVVVCAYPEGDSEDACLAALTGDARVRARNDAFAASLRDVHSESPPPEAEHAPAWLAFRFLAFEHANDLHAMPPPSSGVEQAAFGVDARVSTSRVVVALMMILMGLVAASIVLKRAREGANLAESVLRAAGATDEEQEAERGQLSLTTWLSALAVLGAFIVVAIMVLSRGM